MGWCYMNKGVEGENQACELCKEPVKAGDIFYYKDQCTKVEHARCAWEQADKKKKG